MDAVFNLLHSGILFSQQIVILESADTGHSLLTHIADRAFDQMT